MTTHFNHSTAPPIAGGRCSARFPSGKFGPALLPILQSATDGVVVVDVHRQIVFMNQVAEQMFGYPASHLMEKPLDLLLPATLGSEQRRRIERLAASRVNGRRLRFELKGVHANGEHIALNASVSRVPLHGEHFIVLALQPVAQDGRMQALRLADLRKWAASTQQANEVEKRRFSKKLYDDIGQRLSVLKLDLDWLENTLPDTSGYLPERVAQMQGLLDNVISMTKSVASALRPPLLDDFGLIAAVEWMAENFRKKTGVVCMVENKGVVHALDDQIETAAFRVVQESLSNIERHAHAHNVRIVLARNENQLDVMIHDDGVGMASENDNKPGCYGLIAMRERVFVLGGTVRIQNLRPQGLAIHAAIPI